MDGRRVRGLAAGGAIRIVEADVLGPALHTAAIHRLAPSAARFAAEGVAAAVVLAASLKDEDRMTLQVQTERPEVALYVEVRADGSLRARLTPTRIPPGAEAELDGLVLLIRSDPRGEVYRGMTAVRGESLTRAINRHLAESDQIDARVSVQVMTDGDGILTSVVGRLVERLPEEPERPSLSREAFAALDHGLLAIDTVGDEVAVPWRCSCSYEKVEGMLAGLPETELAAMIAEDHGAEVTCHFCQTTFRFDEADLRLLQFLSSGTAVSG